MIIIASTDHFSEDIMDNHNIELSLYYWWEEQWIYYSKQNNNNNNNNNRVAYNVMTKKLSSVFLFQSPGNPDDN